ncbi:MAG TPA: polysaccharide deacetylase family protein [Acidobacteriota bacterium]|nr:polysaccharide deacetylase family protein [Acidobacteriota bacterium]
MLTISGMKRTCDYLVLITCLLLALPQQVHGQAASKPNELGRVLILEYHLIEQKETQWARTPQDFRRDLEQLYQAGYRTMAVGDYIDGRNQLPSGTHPVILTFDDSSPGQFRYLNQDGKKKIDPDCAVGIMIDFAKRHPDFGRKAIFFVLPAAAEPHRLFGQPEYEGEKLKELASLGFEIGNHTLWHANLGKYEAATVKKQLALAVQAVQRFVPGYHIRALSLPFGVFPKDSSLAMEGSFAGVSYHNEAIMLVSGPPAQSPFSKKCELLRLPRIQVTGNALKSWLKHFTEHPGDVFTSDGDPTTVAFPRDLESEFNGRKFPALHPAAY